MWRRSMLYRCCISCLTANEGISVMPCFKRASNSSTSSGPSRPARLSGFIRLRIPALEGVSEDLLLPREGAIGKAFRRRDAACDVLFCVVLERVRLAGDTRSSGADRLVIMLAYNLEKREWNEQTNKRQTDGRTTAKRFRTGVPRVLYAVDQRGAEPRGLPDVICMEPVYWDGSRSPGSNIVL